MQIFRLEIILCSRSTNNYMFKQFSKEINAIPNKIRLIYRKCECFNLKTGAVGLNLDIFILSCHMFVARKSAKNKRNLIIIFRKKYNSVEFSHRENEILDSKPFNTFTVVEICHVVDCLRLCR